MKVWAGKQSARNGGPEAEHYARNLAKTRVSATTPITPPGTFWALTFSRRVRCAVASLLAFLLFWVFQLFLSSVCRRLSAWTSLSFPEANWEPWTEISPGRPDLSSKYETSFLLFLGFLFRSLFLSFFLWIWVHHAWAFYSLVSDICSWMYKKFQQFSYTFCPWAILVEPAVPWTESRTLGRSPLHYWVSCTKEYMYYQRLVLRLHNLAQCFQREL